MDDDSRQRAARIARRDQVLAELLTELGLADTGPEPITEPLATVRRPESATPGSWLAAPRNW
jgi:hypothetical protein